MSVTESYSRYSLDELTTQEILKVINEEDQKVALAVNDCLPTIQLLIDSVVEKMQKGGRLFYIGAGTSGRLGILDASECPPTYGVPHNMVIGLIAGGDKAIRKAVEYAEDSTTQAWIDLQEYSICDNDVVVGIAASGTTPYVIHGLKTCKENGIITANISCNLNPPINQYSDYSINVIVGPEVVSGSTRMKSGTAQKLVLNMITTTTMIKLGHVKGNKMVDMQLSNHKLELRAVKMVMDELQIDENVATSLVKEYKSVRKAIDGYNQLNLQTKSNEINL